MQVGHSFREINGRNDFCGDTTFKARMWSFIANLGLEQLCVGGNQELIPWFGTGWLAAWSVGTLKLIREPLFAFIWTN